MAFFECLIGGGSDATITVSYDSSFYNKTMTCSNGIDTYTQTTTSSGVTEFEVDSEGTWTITCNGVSKTVDVMFNYPVSMTITKNITVYSAANDTISFTDASGSKTVTTNSSGQGNVSITISALGQNVTFTSSVAKDPNNLSLSYSKTIALSGSTTTVDLMPTTRANVLYWYGYKNPNLEDITTANGWSIYAGMAFNVPTYATNYIYAKASTVSHVCGIANKIAISGTTAHSIVNGTDIYGGSYIRLSSGGNKDYTAISNYADVTSSNLVYTTVSMQNQSFVELAAGGSRGANIYGLWYT